MSAPSCIEISSTYRDRFLYPNPSEFVVKISESGISSDSTQSINPISLSYPYYNFQGPSGEDWNGSIIDPSGASLSGSYTYEPLGAGTTQIPNIDSSNNQVISGNNVSTENGYYEGLYFTDYSGNLSNPINLSSSSIVTYSGMPVSNSLANNEKNATTANDLKPAIYVPPLLKVDYEQGESCSCILQSSLNNETWRKGNTKWAINNSNIKSISNGENGCITIHGGKNIDGLYVNCYIENISIPISPIGNLNGFSNINDRFKLITKYTGYNRKINIDLSHGGFQLSTSSDPSGGWLPCDKYRIRDEPPLVMGWGIDEPYPLGPNSGVNVDNCSGTGPTCGQQNAVYEISIIDEGTSYVTGKYSTTNTGSGDSLYVEIINIGNNRFNATGAVKNVRIIFPGRNYSNGEICTLNGGDNNCKIRIVSTGQSIDISNGRNSEKITTGILSSTYNEYKGDFIYLSSRGPEFNNSVLYKKPAYYNQLPPRLSKNLNTKNKFNQIPFNSDFTGCEHILSYFTYNGNTLYDNSTMSLPNDWAGENVVQTPSENGAIIIIKGFQKYGVVGGSENGSGNTSPNKWYDTSGSVNWEIQKCNYEGVNDLIYYGSKTSQNQQVQYNITLLSLILPNSKLITGNGGQISSQPFIYIEFSNISTSQGNKQLISSNNPNSTNILFKVPIKDISTPVLSRFIKLDAGGMSQIINFKPNDDLKIRIYFGDGELFTTALVDNSPPLKPNPDVQISAIFNIQRI